MASGRAPRLLHRFAREGEAVSALEYATLVGIVALAVAGALVLFSDDTETAIENIGAGVGAVRVPTIPKLW